MPISAKYLKEVAQINSLIKTDLAGARLIAEKLIASVIRDGDATEKAELYHLMGLIEFYDNKAKQAIAWYNKELKIHTKVNDIKGISKVLNNLGAVAFHQGKLSKAKEFYEMSLVHRTSLNDLRGIAAVYNNIGGVFIKCGMDTEAFKMHSKALAINKELGDSQRVGVCLQNIGLIYLSQGDHEQALSHLQEALHIARVNKETVSAIQLMLNIGTTLLKENKPQEAKKIYQECLKESKIIRYQQGIVVSLNNLAYIARISNAYPEAIKHYTHCIEVAQDSGFTEETARSLSGIGAVYFAMGINEKALGYMHDALKLARKTGIKEIIADSYSRLSDIYEKTNNYKKALEYHKKHIAIRDELVNRETTRTINEIKTRYEVEKKEKEAQLLLERNEAINVYARKLEASNNSLKQFAHVASHDLREPLRMVSSYMGLLEKTMGDNISAHQRQFLDFAIDGARRMDTLIHDLLHLAKVDADPKVERVSLTAVVDEVRNNIQILLREKNAQIIATTLPAIMADRTQVMQLFQNIISNGIKYNESAQPTITISFETQGANTIISIADNGIGIAPELREHAFELFRRVHTDKKYQGSGIGLAICKKIVDGLGGTISIDGNDGGGSIFRTIIPAPLAH